MKNRILLSLSALVVVALVFTGCQKLPQVEIDNANLAVEEVKAVQADVYAAQSFTAMQDTLNAALEGIEVAKSKLFKNYKPAKAQLISVVALSAGVKAEAEAKKAELKAQAGTILAEVTALCEQNKELAAKAPKGKGGSTVLMAIKADIATIEAGVIETQGLVETTNLFTVVEKANALKSQATSINEELSTVLAKYIK
jgi:Tfp pilus assembly major pilin PilA